MPKRGRMRIAKVLEGAFTDGAIFLRSWLSVNLFNTKCSLSSCENSQRYEAFRRKQIPSQAVPSFELRKKHRKNKKHRIKFNCPFSSCLKPLSEAKCEAIEDMKKIFFFLMQITLIFTRKVFAKCEFLELGNGLITEGQDSSKFEDTCVSIC